MTFQYLPVVASRAYPSQLEGGDGSGGDKGASGSDSGHLPSTGRVLTTGPGELSFTDSWTLLQEQVRPVRVPIVRFSGLGCRGI